MKYLIDDKPVTIEIKHRTLSSATSSDWYAVHRTGSNQSLYLTDKGTWEVWSHKVKNHMYWNSYREVERTLNRYYKSLEVLDFELGI